MKNSDDESPTPKQIRNRNSTVGPLTAEEIQSLREEMQRDGQLMKKELERRGKKKWNGYA
ncbi:MULTISPECIES: hypothetical protein [Pseudomonas syringae group]|uniref:Integrase n=1 Tax=Pseudomonas syringae pv. viburni TaxID=251703 RepID=A0A0Q0EFM0_9PSED|nr:MULTISPECIES: hypothetical protein [Pseudomonas syringae group]KPZ21742.1 hypothetical protein ALO40_200111 [Pseudomonas syringae pv. viburni]